MNESSKKLLIKLQTLVNASKKSLLPKEWNYPFERSVLSFQSKSAESDGDTSSDRPANLPPFVRQKKLVISPALRDSENDLSLSESHAREINEKEKLIASVREKLAAYNQNDIPQWKTRLTALSVESINSRTKFMVEAVMKAERSASRIKRLEDFSRHLMRYTEAQAFAVQGGALSSILSLRRSCLDEATQTAIREVLVLLGHVDPPPSSGIRILTIDGGGMRGLAVLRMLHTLESLSGRPLHQLFDYICGVSTGAIITCCVVPPVAKTLEQVTQMYRDLSSNVFKQSAIWGTSKLFWSHGYYDTAAWESLLKSHVGALPLLNTVRSPLSPKISTISAIVNQSKCTPFLFRNYVVPYLKRSDYKGSCQGTIFDAVRASAAAPTIFEEYKIDELVLQDGGIFANNPAAVAIHEAKTLWPHERISCLVSCGTGKYNPVQTALKVSEATPSSSVSWKGIFDKILDSATDTESVHTMLCDLLPENVYFRLNPHLTEHIRMDEIREDKLKCLEDDTDMYVRRNTDKFQFIAKKLSQPRSFGQKCADQAKLQIKVMGYS